MSYELQFLCLPKFATGAVKSVQRFLTEAKVAL